MIGQMPIYPERLQLLTYTSHRHFRFLPDTPTHRLPKYVQTR